MSISIEKLALIIEAALLAADAPLSKKEIKKLFADDEKPDNESIVAALQTIEDDCKSRSYELKEVGSGWRFQVSSDVSEYVSRLWEEKPQRYTRALLETLALIAYRQPITRGDIEEVRGVAVSSNIMRTLMERDWVQVVGHRDVPGRPAMYATTKDFLDYFNLSSLDQLPSLSEIKSLDEMAKEADGLLAEAFAKVGLTAEDVLEQKKANAAAEELAAIESEEQAVNEMTEGMSADVLEAGENEAAPADEAAEELQESETQEIEVADEHSESEDVKESDPVVVVNGKEEC